MDYFKQRREYRKLKQNEIDISIGQNNLYRELLDYANDEGKLDCWFPLKNSALTDLTGLSIPGLAKARNSLIQLNLIEYKQGKKNTDKPQYRIVRLYNNKFSKSNTTGLSGVSQPVDIPVSQQVEHKDLTSTIQVLDKDLTKSSESSNIKHSESSAVQYWLNQIDSAAAPFITQSIQYWVNDFEGQDEIVIQAINDMLAHDARSYSYLDKILKSWEESGLDTPEKVRNYLAGKYRKKAQRQAKGRVEQLPDHIANPMTEAEASEKARQELINLGVTINE
ncbi:DnaD domain-containing protein [Enterococcus dongliensis]|uniref:DnaD domain-containing protein n=1 Tax=Enterococcus dongliensis TaxID=2559925 RepID=UPI00288F945F|nr:DnaD domain protein [Enterococcus dongliensis]MDT2673323.1 DnaD domain protein [Enterococcus dongliensis]